MIVVTGAAGFIGSCLIAKLNHEGYFNIVAVDDFSRADKVPNLADKKIEAKVDRSEFLIWLRANHIQVQLIFHLGARTDTTELNPLIFNELNLNYSKEVWNACVEFGLPLIYASSAATYGAGELGYVDNESLIPQLKPLNPYGESKNEFDKWALQSERKPYFWVGLKFFNVYGPNEYHKGRMASVAMHSYNRIKESGQMKLFMSHKKGLANGEQKRDFIYVKDIIEVCMFLMHNRKNSGIYNLGTGMARSFNDLAKAIFQALNKEPHIEYIPTPEDIRDSYQYFTEAEMSKLRNIGYCKAFYSLEAGVYDYVSNYLSASSYY
jgi:ADP-L-glycero-D-manno-heptose 6-epimerase